MDFFNEKSLSLNKKSDNYLHKERSHLSTEFVAPPARASITQPPIAPNNLRFDNRKFPRTAVVNFS